MEEKIKNRLNKNQIIYSKKKNFSKLIFKIKLIQYLVKRTQLILIKTKMAIRVFQQLVINKYRYSHPQIIQCKFNRIILKMITHFSINKHLFNSQSIRYSPQDQKIKNIFIMAKMYSNISIKLIITQFEKNITMSPIILT